jgi:uncharacterized membrane protein
MHKNRIEAFSDGVVAIIITVMVLELKIPQGTSFADLLPLKSIALCYFLSFIYLAIYWNNHHHLFQTVKSVSGAIMWANIYLLFWLSLIPFVTAWAGENHFASVPTALYGFILLMAACAYSILTKIIILKHADHSLLEAAIGSDFKGKISILLYAIAIPIAFWAPIISFGIYIVVAMMWFVPDKRIENKLQDHESH